MKKMFVYFLIIALVFDLGLVLLAILVDTPDGLQRFNETFGVNYTPKWVGWVFTISLFVCPALLITILDNKNTKR